MLVRVLGEVSLLSADGSVVPLRGRRQTGLLAALAARAGQVVCVDRLVDLLWGEALPENPTAALYGAVFKLRANLTAVSGRDVLRTRDRGYVLELEPGDLDAEEFRAQVRDARDQPAAAAAERLERALSLWHGPRTASSPTPRSPSSRPSSSRSSAEKPSSAAPRCCSSRVARGTRCDS